MLVRICPQCSSTNVHRSRRRTVAERMASMFFRRPYRCFDCNHRFTTWSFGKSMASKDTQRPWGQHEDEQSTE